MVWTWTCVLYRFKVVEHRTRLILGSTTKLVPRALEYYGTGTPYVKDPLPEITRRNNNNSNPFEGFAFALQWALRYWSGDTNWLGWGLGPLCRC